MLWLLSSFLIKPAQAHVIGHDPWCIAPTPVHYECFYLENDECEKAAKKRSDPFTQYQCVAYPIDFRNIPKTGETMPVTIEKKSEKTRK